MKDDVIQNLAEGMMKQAIEKKRSIDSQKKRA